MVGKRGVCLLNLFVTWRLPTTNSCVVLLGLDGVTECPVCSSVI